MASVQINVRIERRPIHLLGKPIEICNYDERREHIDICSNKESWKTNTDSTPIDD